MALISQFLFVAMTIICISGASEEEQVLDLIDAEAAPDVVRKTGRGRFLANFDEARMIPDARSSRRQLSIFPPVNRCSGRGYSDCSMFPPAVFWRIPACCTDLFGNSFCTDIDTPLRCGDCTTSCALGEQCCNGVCSNPVSDSKNCGKCGRVCPSGQPCTFFMCGY